MKRNSMMTNVNEKVCRNVKALCKMHGVMLKDIEKSIGKNPGYFSRRCKVTADQMIILAQNFEISIEDLIANDYESALRMSDLDDGIYAAITDMRDQMKLSKDDMMKKLIRLCNMAYGGGVE